MTTTQTPQGDGPGQAPAAARDADAAQGMRESIPVLVVSLVITAVVAVWGLVDVDGLSAFVGQAVTSAFTSRGWFIMLTASIMLLLSLGLAFSPAGRIRLGRDDERPEFSTTSWLAMMFAAGMGVGLLFYGAAEPLTHFALLVEAEPAGVAAGQARFVTFFHWGLHAWAIYGLTALVIAYFAFRRGEPTLVSAPLKSVFGVNRVTKAVGWASDVSAITAIAIGVGGSVALGVFQLQGGLAVLFGEGARAPLATTLIFAVVVLAFMLPLLVDLGAGMSILSNIAMALAIALLVYVILAGPTSYLMSGTVGGIGEYISSAIPHGFQTYTYFDRTVEGWFQGWTLNYMAWWLAWGPFVGVFVARISRGRTIREFVAGVIVGPTVFSMLWFGVFGSFGFYSALRGDGAILQVVAERIDDTTFALLASLPLSTFTTILVVCAAFLFVVTSVVSAVFVLGMFATGGRGDPPVGIRLAWGGILAALALVMILAGSLDTVKAIISLGALPFVFIVHLLIVSLVRALRDEKAGSRQ